VGLYLSVLACPRLPLREALWISLATGLAVQSAIKTITGLHADIRWPNDLLLPQPSGHDKKTGGILVEAAVEPGEDAMLRYAVIGIGINVNQTAFPPELDTVATSLLRELSPSAPLRREPLAAAILIALDTELRCLSTNNQQLTKNNLSQYSTWLSGKRVRVEARDPAPNQPSASYTGTTAGLNPSGFLLVRDDDGLLRTVLSGGLREP
jgi:BirA family biotin operon repressor/biotin-[acetyl-CoA-carboxylase] ligase